MSASHPTLFEQHKTERTEQSFRHADEVAADPAGLVPAYRTVINPESIMNDNPIQGLPVAGYKKTQPQWAVDLVNQNKALEELILRQIDRHRDRTTDEVDQRFVAMARTDIQIAFMKLNRSVFQPERIAGQLELDFLEELSS